MADKESEDGSVSINATEPSLKQQGLFGSSGIQLTQEEQQSSATSKFLRHLNSKQEDELVALRTYQNQYYDKRQDYEVLKKEKEGIERELTLKKTNENLQKVMISCGSLLLGSMKLLVGWPWYVLFILAIISTVLILGGMFPALRIGAAK